jgi:hypothetical protein
VFRNKLRGTIFAFTVTEKDLKASCENYFILTHFTESLWFNEFSLYGITMIKWELM